MLWWPPDATTSLTVSCCVGARDWTEPFGGNSWLVYKDTWRKLPSWTKITSDTQDADLNRLNVARGRCFSPNKQQIRKLPVISLLLVECAASSPNVKLLTPLVLIMVSLQSTTDGSLFYIWTRQETTDGLCSVIHWSDALDLFLYLFFS